MTLGDIIKEYRKVHSMSMDSFSEKSGISKSYISLLENNKHPKTGNPIAPSIQCIKQAADGMNMDFNKLFSMLDSNVTVNNSTDADRVRNRSCDDENSKPITSQRLIQALSDNNMKPVDLARTSGVSQSSISQYINGSHAPSNISSIKMANVLNVSPAWLMGFNVPKNTTPYDYIIQSELGPITIEAESASNKSVMSMLTAYYSRLNEIGRELLEDRANELIKLGYTNSTDYTASNTLMVAEPSVEYDSHSNNPTDKDKK